MSCALILGSGLSAILRQQPRSTTILSPSLCIAAAFRLVQEASGLRVKIEPAEKCSFSRSLNDSILSAELPNSAAPQPSLS